MDPTSAQDPGDDPKLGYTQALIYGKDLARLYTQEKAKRRDLQLANQKLEAILGTAPNGLAVLDETMTIVETNPCFEAFVERNGNCVGQSVADVLPSDDLVAALETASQDGQGLAEVEVNLVIEPMTRTLHVIGAPLSAGNQRGWVVSLHDITERKRLEGLKEEFVNIAAHELRTPLAIILGYTTVLREELEDSDDSVTTSAVDSIIKAADQLRMVINELVGFAAAKSRSSGEVGVDRFDIWKVVQDAVGSVRHHANLNSVSVVVEAGVEPLPVHGDRVILAQAFGHLLDNAVKFNQPGGQVRVRATKTDGETIVEIEDTGIGIPLTDLDRIFDKFYQVEGHMTRAAGGLGMGLAIAKRGVELHGGSITVESALGQGSCFRVTLPQSIEQTSISTQTRLETAHQQTLAFGHDLARAFVTQQALVQRLNRASALSSKLLDLLEQPALIGANGELASLLDEVRSLAQQLADEET
jgi:two-component system phosphate regulon sensor histidine kinase PhoR